MQYFRWEWEWFPPEDFQHSENADCFATAIAIIVPMINGCLVAALSEFFIHNIGNRFIFAILASSASYIAVSDAMRLAAPKADMGLYIPMALGITFPFNITIGIPLYYLIVTTI